MKQELSCLEMYLKQIGDIKLLSKEEEKELAEKIADGDKKAREKLIQSNLRLVVSIAKSYQNNSIPLLDLIQEGNIGLIKAVDKFNPELGYRFSTFATWWIKQTITKALTVQSRAIRLPHNMVEKCLKITKAKDKYFQENNQMPTTEEIAQITNIEERHIKTLENYHKEVLSLDIPVDEENRVSFGDTLEDTDKLGSPMRNLMDEANKEIVQQVLCTLSEKEKEIITMRFGLNGTDSRTLEDIGKEWGVTKERIRQIETKAMIKLRNPIRKNKLAYCFVEGE